MVSKWGASWLRRMATWSVSATHEWPTCSQSREFEEAAASALPPLAWMTTANAVSLRQLLTRGARLSKVSWGGVAGEKRANGHNLTSSRFGAMEARCAISVGVKQIDSGRSMERMRSAGTDERCSRAK
ncbi:hypothetical protein B0H13DRAFT_1110262 [Mycena leptocephala]|nr:hypothetical protein B0H13DRAFT_1110262 [Mycena leptocephala]